jgi:protein-disulfide isomerase
MLHSKLPIKRISVCALVVSASVLFAQTPPGPEVVPCGAPIVAAPPCLTADKGAPATLAVVDSTVLTVKDLDEKLRKKVEHLDEDVAKARREALQSVIDDALVASEAARLHVAPRELYFDEVVKKIAVPSEADLKAEYDGNRARYGSRTFDEVREWIPSVVAEQREKTRLAEYTKSLQSRFPVAMKADPGANVPDSTLLATVGTRPITAATAATPLAAAEYNVRSDLWQEESAGVKKLVHEQLVRSEAARRGVTAEALVRSEVSDQVAPPTDDEIAKYYQQYRSFYGDDLASARSKVIDSLQRDRKQAREEAFDRKLREGHQVRIALAEPASPHLTIDTGRSPSRGSMQAAVTIVEFGDFQCPPCGRMYGIVEEALAPYGDRVRYVFRHYPMGFHQYALKAAEAAMAAQEQGKFWEYADVLFHNQQTLDVASLKRFAAKAGLGEARFAKDLDSGRFEPAVLEEKRIGARYGVAGTPAFFVNGVRLPYTAYNVEGLRATLDAALANTARTASDK